MGNWCCPAFNSCENVEEISGLLPGSIKVPASSSESGDVAGVHNGSEAFSEMRKMGEDKQEGNKEKVDAVVATQERLSASPKDEGKEDPDKSLPTVTNGLLSSPNTNTGVIAKSLLTAPDQCTKKTGTLEESPATKRAPVEAKRCPSGVPLCPDVVDANTGDEVVLKVVLNERTAEDTCTEVHKKRSAELTVTPDAAVKAEGSPEHISSDTVFGDSTMSIGSTANLSKPEEGCSVVVVVPSVLDAQPTAAESGDRCVVSQEKCLRSSGTTDTVHQRNVSSSNFVIKDVDDGENMSSDACIDDSLNYFGCGSSEDPEQSPAVTEAMEPTQKSPVTATVPTSHLGACKSLNLCEDEKRAGQGGLTEVPCLGDLLEEDEEKEVQETMQDEKKDKGEVEDCALVTVATLMETEGQEGQKGADHKLSTVADVMVDVLQVRKEDRPVQEDLRVSEDDLYLGAEELHQGSAKHAGPEPLFEITLPKVEDRCSLDPMVNILSYSEREWKGSTAKSALIRKGYTELSQKFGCLRRVRGDNYCALRATLFQVLSTSTQPPFWLQEEHIFTCLEDLEEQLGEWTFPSGCRQGEGSEDSVQCLKRYVNLLRNRWEAAVGCSDSEERQRLCEHVFRGGEEELGMLEALKLLMLARASELHATMQGGGEVPVFCWLLFARDSSDRPCAFLSNHLSKVGFSGGLEQVEMFLLGYTLRCTIQVYRLYMTDTEEFVTYYPDDHKEDWPSVCLVTEDDRHYNVPVGPPSGLQAPEVPAGASQDLTADQLDS